MGQRVFREPAPAEWEAFEKEELVYYDAYGLNFKLSRQKTPMYKNLFAIYYTQTSSANNAIAEALHAKCDYLFVMFFCRVFRGVPSLYESLLQPINSDVYHVLAQYYTRNPQQNADMADMTVFRRIELLRLHGIYPCGAETVMYFYPYEVSFRYMLKWLGSYMNPRHLLLSWNGCKGLLCTQSLRILASKGRMSAKTFLKVMHKTYAAHTALVRCMRILKNGSAVNVFTSIQFKDIVREYAQNLINDL